MFTHLHVHSNFSLLDGAATVQDLTSAAAAAGMRSLALTDHDALYGAVRFYQAAQAAGIKPIIGLEVTLEPVTASSAAHGAGVSPASFVPSPPPGVVRASSPRPTGAGWKPALPAAEGGADSPSRRDARTTRDSEDPLPHPTHLVLLAEDNEGYSNLCRLVTAGRLGQAQSAGPFSEEYAAVDRAAPVLSQEHLRQHCSHLIALSGCQWGEINQLLARGDTAAAEQVAHYYGGLFGPGNFYIELQNLLLPPPRHRLRYELADLAARVSLPTVATNNVHYVTDDYAQLQDILVCIRHNKSVDEVHPDRKSNWEYGLKSPADMGELFADFPEALQATEDIAQRCNWELDLMHFHFPQFDLEGLRREYEAGVAPRQKNRDRHYFSHPTSDDQNRSRKIVSVPIFPCPHPNETARDYLRRLGYAGAKWRYGEIRPDVGRRLEYELGIIEQKGLCDYFLIVWDIVRFARSRGIRATGRGSAGDSIVSYVLDLTHADPLAHDLLFERFLNPERKGMPDIDVDFCARRRDEVTAYVYERYGAEHVAAVCTLNTFRARSAIRELGKALAMDESELGPLATAFPYIRANNIDEAALKLPEVRDSPFTLHDKGLLLELCHQISGYPRHLSVHVGGLVIGAEPLTNIMPLELAHKGIVISAFDKDDVEALGMLKMDILGLRIHTATDDCLDLIERQTGQQIDIETLPLDDEATYRLLRSTNTIGLFQVESPGQRNLLGRAQPREFEEIIANISLFRPGPVQSDMIKPYILRKHGIEPVTYLHPALETVLKTSFGVIIYQENVLQVAHAIAGFSLGQGDVLRRMMTHERSHREMEKLREEFIEGAVAQGIDRFVADRIFDDISGFAAYGFNKAHGACFARITYQTAYLKAHYPAEFLAGILSAQPMGFYPPRTIAEEAKRLGIAVLPPCVNRSEDIFTVESLTPSFGSERPFLPEGPHAGSRTAGIRPSARMAANDASIRPLRTDPPLRGPSALRPMMHAPERLAVTPGQAIRVGLRLIYGISEGAMNSILQARADGRFKSLRDFCQRTSVPRPTIENLILARAFAFTGQSVPELLWTLAALPDSSVTNKLGRRAATELDFAETDTLFQDLPALNEESELERVSLDLKLLGLSTGAHPFSFWRDEVKRRGVVASTDLYRYADGDRVRIAGIVVARARPPTKSGRTAIFVCMEDEKGLVDAAVFEDCYQRYGRAIVASPVLIIEGRLSRMGKLDLSVVAEKVEALPRWDEMRAPINNGDERDAQYIFPTKNWGQ